MNELRVTLNLRITGELNASITFVHVGDQDLAQAGRDDRAALDAWLAGYSEKDQARQ